MASDTSVKLPELGEGVTEGELVKWLVKPGDSVKPDQPVAEVMTDKATVEVPSPVAGVVKALNFKVGDVIKVENVILTLDGAGASAPAEKAAPAAATSAATVNAKSATPTAATAQAAAASNPAGATSRPGAGATSGSVYPPVADFRTLATPSTRRLAREANVDINQVSGSGLAGRVTREDVMQAGGGMDMVPPQTTRPGLAMRTPPPLTSGGQEERVALRGIRKKIAENLQMAKQIIPHFTLMDEAVVTELVKVREGLKEFAEKNQVKVTYLPFVMKALISSARQYPMFNASIDDAAQEIVYKKYFNIGFAADTPNGLVVPDRKSVV